MPGSRKSARRRPGPGRPAYFLPAGRAGRAVSEPAGPCGGGQAFFLPAGLVPAAEMPMPMAQPTAARPARRGDGVSGADLGAAASRRRPATVPRRRLVTVRTG